MKKLAFVFLLTLVTACSIPPYDKESQSDKAMQASLKTFSYESNSQTISGVEAGDLCNPSVLFIHGAPSEWQAWGHLLGDVGLLEQVHMIAVDRPGYGGSGKGVWEVSLAKQAGAIARTMKHQFPDRKMVVLGHSFGGPVAVQLAIDYPELVASTILLAPSIDPELEIVKWYQRAADMALIKAFLPGPLHVANQEILPLKPELEKQKKRVSEIKVPVSVIQGEDDKLVPAGNADYVAKYFLGADVTLHKIPAQGHFLPWEQESLIKSEIVRFTSLQGAFLEQRCLPGS